jgi:hypothetical protein
MMKGMAAIRKYDGTCCMIKKGKLYKRRQINYGHVIPEKFKLADTDDNTGIQYGWMPVNPDDPQDKYHIEAFSEKPPLYWDNGTYELCGPKIQGNPEGYDRHKLIHHAYDADSYSGVPTDYYDLRAWLKDRDIEGIVWHAFDGRMAKIKKSDFGLKRK